jgi:hypothetical protein
MRLLWLSLLFVFLLVLQMFFLTEAFGSQPGTQVQMNANRPVYFVAAARDYSQ